MVDATQSTDETTASDPSMAQLVPASSRTRNRLLIAIAVVALVAAVFSPNVLRPTVSQPNSGSTGSWSALPSHRQVVTTTLLTAQTWPRVDIHSIENVPGARLVNAWMVEESTLVSFDTTLSDSSYESGLAYIAAAMTGFDAEHDALPQSIRRGDNAILVALWDIDSCDRLDVDPPASPRVETRTIIRTSSTENLPEIAAPGFDVESLRRTGVCA